MRIRGVESLERRGTHRLLTSDGKIVELRITALPASTAVQISRALPQPQPPMLTKLDDKGRPADRIPQKDDPQYQTQYQEWLITRAAAIAYHGLRNEDGVEWHVGPPSDDAIRETYEAVRVEMEGVGFSGDEIVRLAAAVQTLATVTDEMLEDLAQDFPKAPGEPSSG